ncbi:MAG TPA: hypothetical protein VND23_04080 [Acidimicrobiales bacterium]|nr:hypothetical protein [Acidimicrobiales bacterium]
MPTDSHGMQHTDGLDVAWQLPGGDGRPGALTTAPGGLVLRTASALLDELGERIFEAAPSGTTADVDTAGVARVTAATLVVESGWNVERAATFALDCAEHVLGDASEAVLPGGSTLGSVITDAREVIERASDGAEQRLGVLARLNAARRLRRKGEVIGDFAFEAALEDTESAIDALEDPAWTKIASTRDAVLAAVEALRHLALPRYVAAREHTYDGRHDADEGTASAPSTMWATPWGPITFGAEHRQDYEPAWVAARDTAVRARDAARSAGGDSAESDERAWQATTLARALTAPSA